MKRFVILVSALTFLMPLHMSAQVSMAAGVSLGLMDGVGANVAVGITDNMFVRAGFGMFPSFLIKEYPIDLPSWDNNTKPATSTALSGKIPPTGNLLFDYHPGAGSFRLTAGVFFGSEDFAVAYNTKALPSEYHSAGVNYYVDGDKNDLSKYYRIISDDKGVLSGAFKTASVRPYVGIGFGTAVPSGRVGGSFDLGFEYTGGLDLRANAKDIKGNMEDLHLTTAGVLQTIYEIRGSSSAKSYDKYIDYVDKLRAFPVLPVMRFTVFVKLF